MASEVNPLKGSGRDVGNKFRQPLTDINGLAGVDFGNEAVAEQEAVPPVPDTTPAPARLPAKVDANDIVAFRERQEAKRKRPSA
jgi:hypothetical protein